jgi:hypothetical protein
MVALAGYGEASPNKDNMAQTTIDFQAGDEVMIRRSGFPLWLEVLVAGNISIGKVVMLTHPDHESGDVVTFDRAEVQNKDVNYV